MDWFEGLFGDGFGLAFCGTEEHLIDNRFSSLFQ